MTCPATSHQGAFKMFLSKSHVDGVPSPVLPSKWEWGARHGLVCELAAVGGSSLCLLAGLRGEAGFGGPAGTAAGGGGAVALLHRQAVVEACRRHTLGGGFVAHALQLVAHRDALTWRREKRRLSHRRHRTTPNDAK